MSDYLNQLFSLTGKTVLVTGGAKGLGAMMTESLLKAGAKVYISSRSAEDCEAAAKQFSEFGTCVPLPQDLSTEQGVNTLVEEYTANESKLYALINNSGVTWGAPIEQFPAEAFDRVIGLNVKTPFMLVQRFLPLLRASATKESPARVINIGSVAGFHAGTISAYSYQASKAAIHHMTRGLACDLAKDDINVNAIAPGLFASRMTAYIEKDERLQKAMLDPVPKGRMGYPEEIGALALYLCSHASAYMTGNIIPIDGGMLVNGR